MKFNIIATSFIFLIFSCQKDNDYVKPTFSEIIDLSDQDNIYNLTDELGIFTNRLKGHHGNVNIVSTLSITSNKDVFLSGRVTAWALEEIPPGNTTSIDRGEFYINDLELSYNGNNYSSEDLQVTGSVNVFLEDEVLGKEITIKNTLNGGEMFNKTFYVPEQIKLNGMIEKLIPGTSLFSMDKEKFDISFNPDIKNQHGIIVTMSFQGENINMSLADFETVSGESLRKAIYVGAEPQDGNLTIPEYFFDGVPSGGIVTLHIGRGGGELFNLDGNRYFIRTSSEHQIRVVL